MEIAYKIIKCAMKGTENDNIKFHMVGYLQKMFFNNYLMDWLPLHSPDNHTQKKKKDISIYIYIYISFLFFKK